MIRMLALLVSFFGLFSASITTLIDKPGTYVLGGDIIVDAVDPYDAIITISVNQVVLDMGGYMISQTTTTEGVVGVRVNAGLDQISIRNGRIVGVADKGIEIQEGSSGIQVKNLEILHCGLRGISAEGTSDAPINLVQIDTSIVASTKGSSLSPACGLWGSCITSLLIDDTKLVSNDAKLTNSGFGCFLTSCTGISFNNDIISGNGGFERGLGLCLRYCDNLFVRHTLFNGNVAYSPNPTAMAIGAEFIQCNECQFTKCEFVKNTSPFAQAIGLRIVGGEENFLGDSQVQVNKGGISVIGVELDSVLDSRIGSTRITGNTTGGTAYAIKLAGDCMHCYIDNNEIINNSGGVISYGIVDEQIPSESLIISNRAFNQDVNYVVTYTSSIELPMFDASLTDTAIGLPEGAGGILDNLNVIL